MAGVEPKLNEKRLRLAKGNEERVRYFTNYISKILPVQQELLMETSKMVPDRAKMLGSTDTIVLLSNIIKFSNAKKCLDVGVFTGFSSLAWTLSMPEDGRVIACEFSKDYLDICHKYWKKAGVDERIDLRIAPAVDTLQGLIDSGESGTFDFAFIDADKENYDNYYELCLKLIRKNGLIAIDNTWWSGRVLNRENNDSKTVAIRELNEKIVADSRATSILLDIGDGCTIITVN